METLAIVVVIILAVAVIVLLIRRNVKDLQDSDPELTDELEKAKEQGKDIK